MVDENVLLLLVPSVSISEVDVDFVFWESLREARLPRELEKDHPGFRRRRRSAWAREWLFWWRL